MENDTLTQEQAAKLIADKVEEFGGRKTACEAWGVSKQMLHLVLRCERRPTVAMLDSVGLARHIVPETVIYRRKQP